MASDAPSVRERVDDRETSTGHRVTVCTPDRKDGCAIVAVKYLDAKTGIADGDLKRDRFRRVQDCVRHEFRHKQTGLVSHLGLDAVRVQKQSYLLPCASRRVAVLGERQFQVVACQHENPLTAVIRVRPSTAQGLGATTVLYPRAARSKCARSSTFWVATDSDALTLAWHKRDKSPKGE